MVRMRIYFLLNAKCLITWILQTSFSSLYNCLVGIGDNLGKCVLIMQPLTIYECVELGTRHGTRYIYLKKISLRYISNHIREKNVTLYIHL